MARRRKELGGGRVSSTRLLAGCAWACALFAATAVEAHADVDTSTGLSDNTLTNSGKWHLFYNFYTPVSSKWLVWGLVTSVGKINLHFIGQMLDTSIYNFLKSLTTSIMFYTLRFLFY